MCVKLFALKSMSRISELGLDMVTKLMLHVTPIKENLPKSYYEAKTLVSKFGLEARKIDCCVNGHMYYDNEFRKNDSALLECKFCNAPRYQVRKTRNHNCKPIPVKSMFYLSIIPRLQRMFASTKTVGQMSWHYENRCTGVLCHQSEGEAWKHFDRVHPDFASEPWNVRLRLCSYGFTPYIQASTSPYSCWLVVVTPYNLAPEMCMTKPYMFLTCMIPSPTSPKVGIDIYLEPLIDDLKRLWNGIWTYDISRKKNFMMRENLMWTINDFPAYGILSGWGAHGKLACPHCMEGTKAFTLKYGGEASWFDSHRRFLPSDHTFRRNMNAFRKGEVERDGLPPKLITEQVWTRVMDLPKVTDDPNLSRFDGYGKRHNWTKRSSFWDLPFWKDNLFRHKLDVMHIEKNSFDNIFNKVMDVKGKTKDNDKVRMDLALYCKRNDLNFKQGSNGKMIKPLACYSLTSEQANVVCRWLKGIKMPDGYSSNMEKCADVNTGKITMMKSHDCHVFMECLLPISFSSLPKAVLEPLTELSQFFKNLCSTTLSEDDLTQMEKNIPFILCKLERILPHSFFDSMEHLPVLLAYEAKLG